MNLRHARVAATIVLLASMVSACSILPRSAAVEREITNARSGDVTDFAVYPVTRSFLPIVEDWPFPETRGHGWISASGGARTQVIATGDELQVTIWDSTENSLLSAPTQTAVPIESLIVQPDGTIFLPYVGDTQVAGMTMQVARQHLQDEIDQVVPAAQVQLQMISGRSNSVDIVGGVGSPGSYPLPDRNYTILNLIAQSGGVQGGLTNPQVRLVRGGRLYATSIDSLFENPSLNTLLHGGDQVIIEEDERYFLSLGAAGTQSQHAFPQDDLSALDAVSIIGGVQSSRGDPGGVLILREYPASSVDPLTTAGPNQQRVVFSLDLTSADGLFSAGNFEVEDGDLVLVTESPVTAAQTIFGLIGSAFGLANTTANLGN